MISHIFFLVGTIPVSNKSIFSSYNFNKSAVASSDHSILESAFASSAIYKDIHILGVVQLNGA